MVRFRPARQRRMPRRSLTSSPSSGGRSAPGPSLQRWTAPALRVLGDCSVARHPGVDSEVDTRNPRGLIRREEGGVNRAAARLAAARVADRHGRVGWRHVGGYLVSRRSRLRAPAPLATRMRRPPAIATFLKNMISWI